MADKKADLKTRHKAEYATALYLRNKYSIGQQALSFWMKDNPLVVLGEIAALRQEVLRLDTELAKHAEAAR